MLIEAILLSVVLTIGFGAVFCSLRAGIEATEICREAGVAEQLAQARMSEIKAAPLAFIGTLTGTFVGGSRTYDWRTAVSQTTESELLSARVEVFFTVRNRQRSIDLVTLIYHRGGTGP